MRKRLGRNPVGVGELDAVFLWVAEYSNPGLEAGSPSGKMSRVDPPTQLVFLFMRSD